MSLREQSDARVVELLELLAGSISALEDRSPGLVETILRRLSQLPKSPDPTDQIIRRFVTEFRADQARREGRYRDAVLLFKELLAFPDPSELEFVTDAIGAVRSMFDAELASEGFAWLGDLILDALARHTSQGCVRELIDAANWSDPRAGLAVERFRIAVSKYASIYLGVTETEFTRLCEQDPGKALALVFGRDIERSDDPGAPNS